MAATTASDLIPLILSSGAGAFALAVFQGWRDARAGTRQSNRETIEDLIRWRDEVSDKYDSCTEDMEYWRDLAARRGYQLRQAGIVPDDPTGLPPSSRRRHEGR